MYLCIPWTLEYLYSLAIAPHLFLQHPPLQLPLQLQLQLQACLFLLLTIRFCGAYRDKQLVNPGDPRMLTALDPDYQTSVPWLDLRVGNYLKDNIHKRETALFRNQIGIRLFF